jgi:hypothetical protein
MLTALFLVWLQMSAQAVQIPTCQGCWQIWIATPSALDDINRAEFAEAAQRAADETDGKPLIFTDKPIVVDSLVTVAGPLTITDNSGKTVLTCEMVESVPRNCKIAEGHSLDEAMAALYHVIDPHPGKLDCDTRSGEHKLVDPDHLGECLYNGATFDNWKKYSETNESSQKVCRKRGWKGTAAYFDPILQKTYQWPCSTIKKF